MLPVFGYDDAPHGHGEVILKDVRVPADNLILGEGQGVRDRPGPARPGAHLTTACARWARPKRRWRRCAGGSSPAPPSARPSPNSRCGEERIAAARIDIEMTRLPLPEGRRRHGQLGAKGAQLEIAMIKVAAPRAALKIIDDAIQAHGGGGVSDDFGLAKAYAGIRTLRLADGPDEVHNRAIARLELRRHSNAAVA